jgi:hypothetical protein
MKRTELEIVKDIDEVYGALSPENLTHDGELPMSIVKREEKRLTTKLKALFVELGREIDEEQAWRLANGR